MWFKLQSFWYTPSWFKWCLWPLCWPFLLLIVIRRKIYQSICKVPRLNVPVIVIGNITVGGTGKTPFVCALAKSLQAKGYKPGVVSRGYGRQWDHVQEVFARSLPKDVGDEPLLMAKNGIRPVFVGKNRYQAASALLKQHPEVNVIISDDGLQHYALPRDVELLLMDKHKGVGNGLLLPFGPLREPASRTKSVDIVYETDHHVECDGIAINIKNHSIRKPLTEFSKVHAVAGLAHPMKFFALLNRFGVHYVMHPFKDHHEYYPEDFTDMGSEPIIMTEKDAVKCQSFAHHDMWYVPIRIKIDDNVLDRIYTLLKKRWPYGPKVT